ncbi:MAG: cyclic nucleotide-binding domain-containing protein, partial [Spirochaetaceae bacterium]|nr:cyclic nucleotide-binding domain-containing protein [Spirochaetaceae bacterium]
MIPDTLKNLEIFSSLSPEELARVRLLMKRHEVPGDWVLFREGDEGRLMYIVLSGTVAISILTSDGGEL